MDAEKSSLFVAPISLSQCLVRGPPSCQKLPSIEFSPAVNLPRCRYMFTFTIIGNFSQHSQKNWKNETWKKKAVIALIDSRRHWTHNHGGQLWRETGVLPTVIHSRACAIIQFKLSSHTCRANYVQLRLSPFTIAQVLPFFLSMRMLFKRSCSEPATSIPHVKRIVGKWLT